MNKEKSLKEQIEEMVMADWDVIEVEDVLSALKSKVEEIEKLKQKKIKEHDGFCDCRKSKYPFCELYGITSIIELLDDVLKILWKEDK